MNCKRCKDFAGQSLGQVLTRFIQRNSPGELREGELRSCQQTVIICLALRSHNATNSKTQRMDTKLKRIFKKIFGSQVISLQCLLEMNRNKYQPPADYQLSVVRRKEEATESKVNIMVEEERKRQLLIPKKALVWDSRVQNGFLSANQLFNINQWLLSVETRQPDEVDGMQKGDADVTEQHGEDMVDCVDRMFDSFQDFGFSSKGRRLTTLV